MAQKTKQIALRLPEDWIDTLEQFALQTSVDLKKKTTLQDLVRYAVNSVFLKHDKRTILKRMDVLDEGQQLEILKFVLDNSK